MIDAKRQDRIAALLAVIKEPLARWYAGLRRGPWGEYQPVGPAHSTPPTDAALKVPDKDAVCASVGWTERDTERPETVDGPDKKPVTIYPHLRPWRTPTWRDFVASLKDEKEIEAAEEWLSICNPRIVPHDTRRRIDGSEDHLLGWILDIGVLDSKAKEARIQTAEGYRKEQHSRSWEEERLPFAPKAVEAPKTGAI